MRRIRYQEIAAELRARAAAGPAGSLLPSEAELSAEFGASRVTVRRALELVREDGLIAARQGFGWFVATEPVRQRLEHLGTIEDQLHDSGRRGERRVIEFAFETTPARCARCSTSNRCCASSGSTSPTASRSRSSRCGAQRSSVGALSREDVERRPFYELLDVELRGATQTIGADAADSADAKLLGVPVGAPLLRCQRVTTDTAGRPVLMSEHLFPAHRTEFVVELPLAEPSTSPAGLRLVE